MTETPMKRCSQNEQCIHPEAKGGWLPATREYFYKNPKGVLGLTGRCKKCVLAINKSHKLGLSEPKHPRAQTIIDGKKLCSKCEQWKSLDAFNSCSHTSTKLQSWCKSCILNQTNEYHAANYDVLHALNQARYQLDAERIKANARDYYWEHRDNIIAHKHQYRRTHRLHVKSVVGVWRQRNRDRALQQQRQRRKLNPAYFRLREQAKRQRVRQLPYDFTPQDWEVCLAWWGNRCAVCGRPESESHVLALDHWIPIKDISPDNPGTVPGNIVPLCHARPGSRGGCNNIKGARNASEFLITEFGEVQAQQILAQVLEYFSTVRH